MGHELFSEVTAATGLPPELITNELESLIQAAGIEKDSMTLDDLRRVLAEYVQDILLDLKTDLAKPSEAQNPK